MDRVVAASLISPIGLPEKKERQKENSFSQRKRRIRQVPDLGGEISKNKRHGGAPGTPAP
jgi:hypothetical protein